MREVFKYKSSFYVWSILGAIFLLIVAVFFFGIAADENEGFLVGLMTLFGLFLLITSIWLVVRAIKGPSYFVALDGKGINISDKFLIDWNEVEDVEIGEEDEDKLGSFTLTFRKKDNVKMQKVKIQSNVDGYEYIKTVVKKHYEESRLKSVDESLSRKTRQ